MRRGPIRYPGDNPHAKPLPPRDEPVAVTLPPPAILDAGVDTFKRLAKLHWPDVKDGFKLSGFDIKNDRMLRFTIGLVYMAMREADK